MVQNQNMNEKVLPLKLLRNQGKNALVSLAKSQRRGVASFRKTFKSIFTHTSFGLGQARKMPTGYFFLEIAKISQLPERKCGTPVLCIDFHSLNVDWKDWAIRTVTVLQWHYKGVNEFKQRPWHLTCRPQRAGCPCLHYCKVTAFWSWIWFIPFTA